jgi:hypothetical protein
MSYLKNSANNKPHQIEVSCWYEFVCITSGTDKVHTLYNSSLIILYRPSFLLGVGVQPSLLLMMPFK